MNQTRKKTVSLVVLFLTGIFTLMAQPNFNDPKLAREYYMNKEFDKAVILYESLYNSQPSQSNLTFYMNCLWELNDYAKAEKVLRKAIKRKKKDLSLLVKLGYNYQQKGETDRAKGIYEDAIKQLKPKTGSVYQLANAFRSYRLWEYAEKSYLKGRSLLNNPNIFNNELASIYMMQRKYNEMISEWMAWIRIKPGNIQFVKNQLINLLRVDVEDNMYDMVQKILIRNIQENPSETSYTELLIWLYIQKKEFNKAFIQAKAIDKKFNLEGSNIIKMARLAVNNEDFATALKMYEYIIGLGKKSKYYYQASKSRLEIEFLTLKQKNKFDATSIETLENEYNEAINEFGRNNQSAGLIKDLAHIQAFLLNKQEEAVKNLEFILELGNVSSEIYYSAKPELADIKLLQNKVWDAALLYGQVESDNESNPIGHEAKLRKAKLAYYTGDFLWAQAQLDILKASTSKLIANDAFLLADFINTNTALNTSNRALQMFARADLFMYRQMDSLALMTYDSVLTQFPGHNLIDDALFKKGKLLAKENKTEAAVEAFKTIVENYGEDILGDNALFELATLYDVQLNDTSEAQNLYKQLLTKYPSSIYVAASRERYRTLKGDSTPDLPRINQEENGKSR